MAYTFPVIDINKAYHPSFHAVDMELENNDQLAVIVWRETRRALRLFRTAWLVPPESITFEYECDDDDDEDLVTSIEVIFTWADYRINMHYGPNDYGDIGWYTIFSGWSEGKYCEMEYLYDIDQLTKLMHHFVHPATRLMCLDEYYGAEDDEITKLLTKDTKES